MRQSYIYRRISSSRNFKVIVVLVSRFDVFLWKNQNKFKQKYRILADDVRAIRYCVYALWDWWVLACLLWINKRAKARENPLYRVFFIVLFMYTKQSYAKCLPWTLSKFSWNKIKYEQSFNLWVYFVLRFFERRKKKYHIINSMNFVLTLLANRCNFRFYLLLFFFSSLLRINYFMYFLLLYN